MIWCELGASECQLVWVRLWSLLLTGSSGGGPLEGIRASIEAPGWGGGGGVVPLRPTSQRHICRLLQSCWWQRASWAWVSDSMGKALEKEEHGMGSGQ